MQVIDREEIFQVVARKGPVIPIDVVRELGGDTILIGATLSELANAKRILISHTKRGGSPFYYLPEQSQKLEGIAHYLNEKDGRAFELLKEHKVLKDRDLDPLVRVCLRNIKDFATPHPVGEELYWKYYLLSDADAHALLAKQTLVQEQQPQQVQHVVEQPVQQPAQQTQPVAEQLVQQPTHQVVQKPVHPVQQHISSQEQQTQETKKRVVHKEQQVRLSEPHYHSIPAAQIRNTQPSSKQATPSGFHEQVLQFFKSRNIVELTTKKIGKTEIDFTIDVPSSIGRATYYCKARDKKRINEGDLAVASLQGQTLKLPVVLLITGDVTKRAKELLEKESINVIHLGNEH